MQIIRIHKKNKILISKIIPKTKPKLHTLKSFINLKKKSKFLLIILIKYLIYRTKIKVLSSSLTIILKKS